MHYHSRVAPAAPRSSRTASRSCTLQMLPRFCALRVLCRRRWRCSTCLRRSPSRAACSARPAVAWPRSRACRHATPVSGQRCCGARAEGPLAAHACGGGFSVEPHAQSLSTRCGAGRLQGHRALRRRARQNGPAWRRVTGRPRAWGRLRVVGARGAGGRVLPGHARILLGAGHAQRRLFVRRVPVRVRQLVSRALRRGVLLAAGAHPNPTPYPTPRAPPAALPCARACHRPAACGAVTCAKRAGGGGCLGWS